MIELKQINGGFVTLETLKAANEWLSDVYDCRIAYIDEILCYKQYAAETSWKNARLSIRSVINNIPMEQHRLLLQYLSNNYERSCSIGRTKAYYTGEEVNNYGVFNLNLRTNEVHGIEGGAIPLETKSAHGETRVPVPEGYDGNMAYVELFVPRIVISRMLLRLIDGADWGYVLTLTHPLMEPSNNRENVRRYGLERPHALLFYQRYTKKDANCRCTIKMDVAKSKLWVSIITHADEFTGPFTIDAEDPIAPLVEVKITFYKYGAA